MRFDIVVVGGGTAGCVLASRLSADPRISVALVEAGPDTPPGHQDHVIWDSYPNIAYFDPRHHWTDLRVYHQPRPIGVDARTPRRYEQARVMGGGSSINGMMANRGAPGDYDAWEAAGAQGWGWEGVLPYFRMLERDLDWSGPMHGTDGPLPIRRVAPAEWPGFSQAAGQALRDAGLPYLEDQNDGTFAPGYFPIAINNLDDRRISSAEAYLGTAVRQRPNLAIMPDTQARRLLLDGQKVTGIEVRWPDGGLRRIEAGEVVLASGALHSPALMLRAGIGPGRALKDAGIPVTVDRPGVGANLQEHPQIAVSGWLAPLARQPWSLRRHIFAGYRYSSNITGCPPVDMYGVVVNRGGWHYLGRKLGGFLVWVNKAYSKGEVRLPDPDPEREPHVEFNFLSDHRDLLRLMDALDRLALLYQHPAMRAVSPHPFPSSYTERSRDQSIVTRRTRFEPLPWSWLADAPPPVRERALKRRVTGGLALERIVQDRRELEAFVRERAHGTWHACGTCRMGRADDPCAVTDPAGRVYGVSRLRVADASLMPEIPCANTNIPTMMVAEKIAAAILHDWS